MYTFLTPSEDIGIPCQQEEFDLELLAEKLQKDSETNELCMEELELIKKIAPTDTMDLEEVKHKIYYQYLQLWILYTEISVALKRKSRLSRESTVTAFKVYRPYISDILRQVDEVIKLFSMEKELRVIKNRGHFPVPKITKVVLMCCVSFRGILPVAIYWVTSSVHNDNRDQSLLSRS